MFFKKYFYFFQITLLQSVIFFLFSAFLISILAQTAFLSTPTEYWETRGAAIQEGPVGYTHSGHTYITYSAIASWIPDDYSVGLLTFNGIYLFF